MHPSRPFIKSLHACQVSALADADVVAFKVRAKAAISATVDALFLLDSRGSRGQAPDMPSRHTVFTTAFVTQDAFHLVLSTATSLGAPSPHHTWSRPQQPCLAAPVTQFNPASTSNLGAASPPLQPVTTSPALPAALNRVHSETPVAMSSSSSTGHPAILIPSPNRTMTIIFYTTVRFTLFNSSAGSSHEGCSTAGPNTLSDSSITASSTVPQPGSSEATATAADGSLAGTVSQAGTASGAGVSSGGRGGSRTDTGSGGGVGSGGGEGSRVATGSGEDAGSSVGTGSGGDTERSNHAGGSSIIIGSASVDAGGLTGTHTLNTQEAVSTSATFTQALQHMGALNQSLGYVYGPSQHPHNAGNLPAVPEMLVVPAAAWEDRNTPQTERSSTAMVPSGIPAASTASVRTIESFSRAPETNMATIGFETGASTVVPGNFVTSSRQTSTAPVVQP